MNDTEQSRIGTAGATRMLDFGYEPPNNMNRKLKTCPYCGSEGRILKNKLPGTAHINEYVTRCLSCKSQTGYYKSPELAFYAWNQRSKV